MSGGSGAELDSTERDPPDRPSAPHLLVIAADGTWTSRPLPTSGVLTIGRAAEADVHIDDQAVSREHARLEVIGADELRLVDLGSANGTLIGSKLVRNAGVRVRPGEFILIGRTVLAWHVPPAAGASAEGARPPLLRPGIPLAKGTQPPRQPGLAMADVDARVARAAPTPITVLLLGETGVGKDIIAERIHDLSRRAGPLERLNCAVLSAALLESELFGHEKGAFTGAEQFKKGLLEVAAGGTVFLDEIGEMPMEVQAKLLLAIERRVARRVGATQSTSIDVRFICATNRDLEAEIRHGRFRADFYYRINGITIRIPPLRERRDEINGLISQFASDAATRVGRGHAPTFDEDARARLHGYDWPGNIRELRSVVERAVLFADGDAVTLSVLVEAELSAGAPEPPVGSAKATVRARLIAVLFECGGNQTRAARKLRISRNTLRAWMKKYGIPSPHEGEPE